MVTFKKNGPVTPISSPFWAQQNLMCVVDLGQQLGIEDLNANDITEEIAFECKNLENEDLFALKDRLKSDDEAPEKPT